MEQDKIAVIVWLVSILTVATAMEIIKTFKKKMPKMFWFVLSIILSVLATCSVWYGLLHSGNSFLLPLVLVTGWIAQFILDMYGLKKLFAKLSKAWAIKNGYIKLEDHEEIKQKD